MRKRTLPLALALAALSCALVSFAGCGTKKAGPAGSGTVVDPNGSGLLMPAEGADAGPTRKADKVGAAGERIKIPAGPLVAGSTPGDEGRDPLLEPVLLPVELGPFEIDKLPYPNDPTKPARTGVSRDEARGLCQKEGARLCTELEWERACKGPDNKTYPYGDTHRPASCMTGTVSPAVPPVGVLPSCKSAFGVRDTHGGVFQWTSSPWGRGTVGNLYTLRGGNAAAGDVIGRCANAIGRRPTEVKPDFGARCCSGDRNVAEVTLDVVRGDALRSIGNDDALSRSLAEAPPRELTEALAKSGGDFKVYHTWRWRPIGNEDLVLQSGCAQARNAPHAMCGIAIGRKKGDALEPLAFAPSSWWLPTVHEDPDPRDLWIFGGDELGGYRRRVSYSFGRIVVDEPEHKAVPKKKKKRRD